MTRNIFLAHEDPDFVTDFREKVRKNGTRVISLRTGGDLPKKADFHNALVVIDAEKKESQAILQTLETWMKEGMPFYAIVSTTPLLQKTIEQIDSTSEKLAEDGVSSKRGKKENGQGNEVPTFAELLENRLKDFVRKISASEGKNLYDLLMQEVEKPLIKLALGETDGNQVQASQLLGMHRNTLRKKMKELKITSPKRLLR